MINYPFYASNVLIRQKYVVEYEFSSTRIDAAQAVRLMQPEWCNTDMTGLACWEALQHTASGIIHILRPQ